MSKQIYLWYGDNDFEIHEQLNTWLSAFEKKYTGFNILRFTAEDAKNKNKFLVELKNALQVDSLFGSNKLIIFHDFLVKEKRFDAEAEKLVLSALEKISDSFFVVFIQNTKPAKESTVYSKIKEMIKAGKVESKEFVFPRGAELTNWINKRAKSHQAILSSDCVSLLVANVGNDLWQIDTELSKLANYKKGEQIKAEDINLLVKGKYNDDIFQLMDAISAKDKKKTLKLFQDQLNNGANELYLLSMLTRQFRIFLLIKDLLQNRPIPSDAVAKELEIHPYVAKKSMAYLKNFTFEQLRNIYKKIFEFEILMKTRSVGLEVLFDMMVAEL